MQRPVQAYAAAQLTDMLPRGPGLKPVAPVKPGLVESTLRQMMNQTSGSIATGLLTAILGLLVGAPLLHNPCQTAQ